MHTIRAKAATVLVTTALVSCASGTDNDTDDETPEETVTTNDAESEPGDESEPDDD